MCESPNHVHEGFDGVMGVEMSANSILKVDLSGFD
jgi:hypothetical protein